jgi:parallel beta-helix repeat protein
MAGRGGERLLDPARSRARRHYSWQRAIVVAGLSALLSRPAAQGSESGASPGAVFYVAPNGSDAWTGLVAAPNQTRSDGPFATLGRARDAVRQRAATRGKREPTTVVVRGGRYEVAEPLTLRPEDSGDESAPVVYTSEPGSEVVLSGGARITGWKRAPDGTWVTQLGPGVPRTGFRQISVNGSPRWRARLPKDGYFIAHQLLDAASTREYGAALQRFVYSGPDVRPSWAGTDVEIVILHLWTDVHLGLVSVDARTRVATVTKTARPRFGTRFNAEGIRYYVENVPDPLAPGEWHLDRGTGELRYAPLPGEDLAHAEVVIPRLHFLVRIEGDPRSQRFVKHLALRGFTFRDTGWDLPAGDAGDHQGAEQVPGAIMATGFRNSEIAGCTFTALGTYAVDLREGSRDVVVRANWIHDTGAGGIKINGGAADSPEAEWTGQIGVLDNRIERIGRSFPSSVGVLSMHGYGNTIAHNEIHDLYYTAISVGWVWGYGQSVSRDNVIEANHIHHIGTPVAMLSDLGGIYTLGVAPGTVIRNNWIHDVDAASHGGYGIYLDEGSSGILVENNVVERTKEGSFFLHFGRDNTVRNNLFLSSRGRQIGIGRTGFGRSVIFERNIVSFTEGVALEGKCGPGTIRFDRNVYHASGAGVLTFGGASVAMWQRGGADVSSLFLDPRLTDPEHGNFAVRPDSPAVALGVTSVDLSSVGPRKR